MLLMLKVAIFMHDRSPPAGASRSRNRQEAANCRISADARGLTPPDPTELMSDQPSDDGGRERDDQVFKNRVHTHPISIANLAAKSAQTRTGGPKTAVIAA